MDEARKVSEAEALTDARRGTADTPTSQQRLYPLVELTLSRIREFLREKEAVFWVFVFPVLLACALGIAFRNTAPEEIPVAVARQELAEALARQPGIKPLVLTEAAAAQALRTGKVAIVVRENAAGAGQPAFDYRYDPTRPDSRMARLAVDDALQRALGRADVLSAREETVTETGARYIDFLIPGLIGLNLMGSGMWGLGFGVVVARTQKLLKRLAATPMRRSHYLLSFMLSRLAFLGFEVAAVLVFAWLVFGVEIHGSLFTVALASLVGAMTFSGLGLLVSARPKTIEGVSGLMNLVMMPMWLLSGTFFSSERFPDVAQPFIKALPLTALNDALRAVIGDGAGPAAIAPQLGVLALWGLLSFVIALRLFRWQ